MHLPSQDCTDEIQVAKLREDMKKKMGKAAAYSGAS